LAFRGLSTARHAPYYFRHGSNDTDPNQKPRNLGFARSNGSPGQHRRERLTNDQRRHHGQRRNDVEPDFTATDAAQDLDQKRGESGMTPATQTSFAKSALPTCWLVPCGSITLG
jgi:hypothetical protein